jgi:hypothetical protein
MADAAEQITAETPDTIGGESDLSAKITEALKTHDLKDRTEEPPEPKPSKAPAKAAEPEEEPAEAESKEPAGEDDDAKGKRKGM